MVALHGATQLIDFKLLNLSRMLNADKRESVFALASLLAQTAVVAAGAWRGKLLERRRQAWFVLGVLVGALLLVRGLTEFNAKVLALPLACVFAMLCWLTWRDPLESRTVVWTGLALLATSLLLHKVGLAADTSRSAATDYTWTYQITAVIKHGAELAGWMLVATAIVAGVVGRQVPADGNNRPKNPSELESVVG